MTGTNLILIGQILEDFLRSGFSGESASVVTTLANKGRT